MRFWLTKRIWKRLAISVAILIAIALLVNGVFAWRAEWQLQSRLSAIRAAGDPASIAELAPPPIPDEQNAAAILDGVRPRIREFSKAYGQFYSSPIGKAYEDAVDRNEPPTKEQIDAIRAILARYADVEQGIVKAAACDQYGSRLDFSLGHRQFLEQQLDAVQDARTAARLMVWRSDVLLADRQYEAAVKNGIQALRLARLHENEPTLLAYLVSVAMRGIASEELYDSLAAGRSSPEVHAALEAELAQTEKSHPLVNALKTERAFSADWIYSMVDGRLMPLAHVFGWVMKSLQVGALDAMDEYVQLAARPWFEVEKDWGPNEAPAHTEHGVLANLLVPGLRAAFETNARRLVISRALRIDNALRALADKTGHEAKGLEDLNLPKEATIDPYSGEPLKLKHANEGWIIYSVMANGVDDGGSFIELKDYGLAPPRYRMTEDTSAKPAGTTEIPD